MQLIDKLKNKISKVLNTIWRTKRYRYGAIVLIVIILIISQKSSGPALVTQTVSQSNLKQTVLSSGVVTSQTDLSLSFTGSGMIRKMNVKVGDKVKSGAVLATLEQSSELGGLLGAKAKLQKIIEGATNEEIAVAKTALDSAQINLENTKRTQNSLVTNAYRTLLNTNINAIPNASNVSTTSPTITGSYIGDKEGVYIISVYVTGGAGSFQVSGLESSSGTITYQGPTPFGTKGLFVQFPSGFSPNPSDKWTISLPSVNSSSFTTNYNSYISAINTQNSAVADAQASYDAKLADYNLKIAKARTADIDLAQADVLSAEALYDKTIIRAPADGVITKVAFKVGEYASAQSEAIVLEDLDNLYIEGNVNESRVSDLLIGQIASITFDGLGSDHIFSGKVISIDPGATLDDGVANYKVKVSLDEKNPLIRPGMNATFTVMIKDVGNVIAITESAIHKNKKDENDVRDFVTIINAKKKQIETPITTGIKGDGNLIEITSGLSVGDTIVISEQK